LLLQHSVCTEQTIAFERFPGAALEAAAVTYRPRRPQDSVLHQVVRDNLLTLLAQGQQRCESGDGYPRYVQKAFRKLLNCGDLSRGFARVRCADCGHERLLALACKQRACGSCSGRRMSEEAAYLVDMVLPKARYRQWTMTFPWHIRMAMARDYKLITAVLGVCMRILRAYQRRCAKKLGITTAQAKTAAVVFVQRFGGALNLNLHLHALLPDAVFVMGDNNTFDVVDLPAPTDEDILKLTTTMKTRVTALIERRFEAVDDDGGSVMDTALAEAMQNVPRTAKQLEATDEDDTNRQTPSPPSRQPRRTAMVEGFSMHANTSVAPDNRIGLEKLCRHGMRPPYAAERLKLAENGDVLLELRRPWPNKDGVSVLRFTPTQFLRRLAALIPPPFSHTVRHFGLLAPGAKDRDLLPAAPVSWRGVRPEAMVLSGTLPDRTDIPTKASQAAPTPSQLSASNHEDEDGSAAPDPASPQTSSCTDQTPAADTATAMVHGQHGQSNGGQTSPLKQQRAPLPPPTIGRKQAKGKRPPRKILKWNELLRRVFAIDVLVCSRCGGPMTVLAFLTDPEVVEKILLHLGLPTEPKPLAPARPLGQMNLFDEGDLNARPRPAAQRASDTQGRAPPGTTDADWTVEYDPTADDDNDWAA
jgi:hypothetical protein